MKQIENTQEKYPNLISAEILADSLNQFVERITTMKLIFPRIILAEFNTHRMFNRNSASSRAIPLHKMIKAVEENPFIPIAWQKEILYLCRKIKLCTSTKQQTYLMVKFI